MASKQIDLKDNIDGTGIICTIDGECVMRAQKSSVYLGTVKGSKVSWKLYSDKEEKSIYCRPGMPKSEVIALMKKKAKQYANSIAA